MIQKIIFALCGLIVGIAVGYLILSRTLSTKTIAPATPATSVFVSQKGEVIGFLPYWLLDRADKDYSKYLTTLVYFALTMDSDGTIKRYTNPIEGDPGWFALKGGKFDTQLDEAKKGNMKLSLAVFSSNEDDIESALADPSSSAKNLVDEVVPVMNDYGFTDLNIDVESIKTASPESRVKFGHFVKEVSRAIKAQGSYTVSIDISPIAFVKDENLVDPMAVEPYVDHIILMAYDFHHPGSYVTGANAPLGGAGVTEEFDTKTAVEKALKVTTAEKTILGMPLYGYSWETLGNTIKSAVMPSSSVIISTQKVEEFMQECATCSAQFDKTLSENYVIYKDQETGTFHQIFYPTAMSTQAKIDLAKSNHLFGVALWAIGYEDNTILNPLVDYRR